jgi:DNA-binding response OmpR family regulator
VADPGRQRRDLFDEGGGRMRKRLLIVDDEVTFAGILTEYFEEKGFDVRTVHDGATALVEAKKFKPTVILTDIQMPVRSGYDWTEELMRQASRPVLIFMSAYDQFRDKTLVESGRADGYLQKPFKLSELERIIDEGLEQRRLGRADALTPLLAFVAPIAGNS